MNLSFAAPFTHDHTLSAIPTEHSGLSTRCDLGRSGQVQCLHTHDQIHPASFQNLRGNRTPVLPSSFWFIAQKQSGPWCVGQTSICRFADSYETRKTFIAALFSRLSLMTQQPPLSSDCRGAARYHPLPQVAAPVLLRWSELHLLESVPLS